MKSAILVTGGAGYVGSHTVAALLEEDTPYEVVVVDNLANAHKLPGQNKPEPLLRVEEITKKKIKFYEVDIRDENALSEVFDKHKIECVIHFAALKAVGESVQKPLEYYQTNITGTCVLFEVMRQHGVFKLIYSSSCTVYGDPVHLPLPETHPTGSALASPYGKSKYYCEEIMKDLCTSEPRWRVISLRYFNPVGAHPSGRIGEDPAGRPNNLMPYIAQVRMFYTDNTLILLLEDAMGMAEVDFDIDLLGLAVAPKDWSLYSIFLLLLRLVFIGSPLLFLRGLHPQLKIASEVVISYLRLQGARSVTKCGDSNWRTLEGRHL
ncbi:UDP-glucose 4-epimerase [Eumeta japonica]|uniref:UDP-glucose 4-epimerase n=1 Tax=Eumeta variegata TaxID=151549 RepID=A0A4C1YBH2_EUMVA|nr:UDP-glucose 4-epimerase [Eumeta japonica]